MKKRDEFSGRDPDQDAENFGVFARMLLRCCLGLSRDPDLIKAGPDVVADAFALSEDEIAGLWHVLSRSGCASEGRRGVRVDPVRLRLLAQAVQKMVAAADAV